MEIQLLSPEHKENFLRLHEDFGKKAKLAGYSAAAVAFLLLGALIVIACGCLCLMLPGVNVISDVILRAVVPGALGITVSIPLIIYTVLLNQIKDRVHEEMLDTVLTYMDSVYEVPEMPRKVRINFFLINFLDWRKNPNDNENVDERPGVFEIGVDENGKDNELLKNTDWFDEEARSLCSELKKRMGEKENLTHRQKRMADTLDKITAKISAPKIKGSKTNVSAPK